MRARRTLRPRELPIAARESDGSVILLHVWVVLALSHSTLLSSKKRAAQCILASS